MEALARAWDAAVAATGPAVYLTVLTTGYMLCMCVMFGVFDYNRWPWIVKYKIQPGKYPKPEHVKIGLLLAFLNGIVIHVPSTLMFPAEKMGIEVDSSAFPSLATFLLHLSAMLLINDFTAYWLHWIEHEWRWLYVVSHKVHHMFPTPSAYHFIAMHPLEYLLGNLASSAAVFAVRPHLLTMSVFAIFRMYQGIMDHCGYDFPWDPLHYLPFGASPAFHDAHHSINTGNYGEVLRLWDIARGTTVEANRERRRKQRGEKKEK